MRGVRRYRWGIIALVVAVATLVATPVASEPPSAQQEQSPCHLESVLQRGGALVDDADGGQVDEEMQAVMEMLDQGDYEAVMEWLQWLMEQDDD